MSKFAGAGFLISFLFALGGCAGKDFVRPGTDAFRLSQTTYSQVVQQMGEPSKIGEVLRNGKQVKSISYAYASTGGEPLEEGVIAARALAYFFYADTLVGQEFISSFKSDNSNFDEKKIDAIKKGQTTRSEAIQLMGKPSASYVPPMVKETAGEAIGYAYVTTRGGVFSGFKIFSKILRISFDDRNLVSDGDYTSSGNPG